MGNQDGNDNAAVVDETSGTNEAEVMKTFEGPSILGDLMPLDEDISQYDSDTWDGEGWQVVAYHSMYAVSALPLGCKSFQYCRHCSTVS